MFGTAFFTHSFTAASGWDVMLWVGALSLLAIAVFYLLSSAMILGLLLRIPFSTNALYAIALVSLTMQDTPGKFDDIAAVNCVWMGKRHRNIWFSLIILQDDLSHFPMQRADPPSTVSKCYWSAFRCQHRLYPILPCWCWYQTIHERNLLDERYSSQMGKGNKKLSVIFISFVQNDVQCSTIHWSVPPSKHFLYTLLGCFTYLHWLYPLLQCWCWHRTIHQGYLYLMFGTAFFTHSFTAASWWDVMLWVGALSLFAIAVFYLLISAMILGLLLRSPFLTNALYAIALVSLTMQDTTGKLVI